MFWVASGEDTAVGTTTGHSHLLHHCHQLLFSSKGSYHGLFQRIGKVENILVAKHSMNKFIKASIVEEWATAVAAAAAAAVVLKSPAANCSHASWWYCCVTTPTSGVETWLYYERFLASNANADEHLLASDAD
jgi:hypothetical protein